MRTTKVRVRITYDAITIAESIHDFPEEVAELGEWLLDVYPDTAVRVRCGRDLGFCNGEERILSVQATRWQVRIEWVDDDTPTTAEVRRRIALEARERARLN